MINRDYTQFEVKSNEHIWNVNGVHEGLHMFTGRDVRVFLMCPSSGQQVKKCGPNMAKGPLWCPVEEKKVSYYYCVKKYFVFTNFCTHILTFGKHHYSIQHLFSKFCAPMNMVKS